MSITKEVKCLLCKSYIHDTERCNEWKSRVYCFTDEKYKKDCDCLKCKVRCTYCNITLYNSNFKCFWAHDGSRCVECNEFLCGGGDNKATMCYWDHTKPFCKFCNLPISYLGVCINDHNESYPICFECNMPEGNYIQHKHDGNKCKICNTLLNNGNCIYNCVNGGIFCIHCGYEGVINNVCLTCDKDNTGQLTKRAIAK